MKHRFVRLLATLLSFVMILSGTLVFTPATASAYTKPTQLSATKKQNAQICFNFFVHEMGLTPAVACGIMANIDIESDFDPTCTSRLGTYHGLFQLSIEAGDERWLYCQKYCQENGLDYNSVIGQLRYIAAEATYTSGESGFYKQFYAKVNELNNDATGAYYAGYYWAQYIERCANTYSTGFAARGNYAKNDFWPVYGQETIDLKDCTITLSAASFTYTGSAVTPTVKVVSPEGTVLTQGTHYTLTYSNNNAIGTASVKIVGKNHCSGTVIKQFTIKMDVAHVNTLTNTSSAVQITWRKVSGATEYRVYRKTASSSYTQLKRASASGFSTNSNGDLVYNDATAVAGTAYTYTVRVFNNGTGYSYDSTGKTIVRLTVPVLSAPSIGSRGINVKWNAVSGATSYKIYRKSSVDSKLREVGSVDGSKKSWTDTTAVSNVVYTYTVRAYATGSQSEFDRTGVSIRFVGKPEMGTLTNLDAGLKVTWKAVAGADSYRVFRRVKGTTTWTKAADLSASRLYWIDTSAVGGKSYEYTVRAAIGSTYGSYDTKGIAGTRLDTPALLKISNNNVGIAVHWQQVAGAEKYYIYRHTNDSNSWKLVHTAESTKYSWTDTTAENGHKYTYTVRAMSGASGTNIRSNYVAAGISMYRLSPVSLTNLTSSSAGTITVSWKANSQASGYLIQYATDEAFTSPVGVNVKSGTATHQTISKLSRGKKLFVRVRAYKTVDSKNYYSYWSTVSSVKVS